MIRFSEFIVEKKQNYIIDFVYKGEKAHFKSPIFRKVYTDVIYWLYENGYKFDETVVQRRLFKKSEIPQQYVGKGLLYNLPNTDLWFVVNLGNEQSIRYLKTMLQRFGVDISSFNFSTNEMLDDNNEDQYLSDEELEDDLEDPNKYNFRLKRFKASQAQEERPIGDIKKFKAIQAQEEREDFFNYSKNSFSQAICVLGESGSGKSTTIDNILDKSNNNYQYIIPSASTTGLLSQYSPSSGYIPSRLGNMIESAYKNPKSLYTAVFDECHKTNIIEMINDELLQAISKNRNRGVRFISLDEDTKNLYPSAKFDKRGNILIPDNLGFIFISSNARVISGNPDFFNRVDLVEITESDRNIKTINELDSRRLFNNEDKKELVNKILGKYNDL